MPHPNALKRLLVRLPLHAAMLDMRSRIQTRAICRHRSEGSATRAYCISPYKSGTTYVAERFAPGNRVAHEPFHYTTLHHLNDYAFLAQRAAYLALDLESSGFFAGRLPLLRTFAATQPILYLSRHPEAWIGSVINYFSRIDASVHYNYTARLFFDPLCKHPVERFFHLSATHQHDVIRNLLEFWLHTYEQATLDPHALIIPLAELDARIVEVSDFLHLKPGPPDAWRRESVDKIHVGLADFIDTHPYRERVSHLGHAI